MGMEIQGRKKKKRKELKLKKKYSKNKSCQMCNRDQLTWQMEVTGVTGRTWTCGGNGGGIKYIADVRAMWWLLSLRREGRNRNVTRGSCMIMCFLNGTFISNIQITMLEALLCHHAYFMDIRKHTGNWKSQNRKSLRPLYLPLFLHLTACIAILDPPSNSAFVSHGWPLLLVTRHWLMTTARPSIHSQLVQ